MVFCTVWELLSSAQCWWHLSAPVRQLVLWFRLKHQRNHLGTGRVGAGSLREEGGCFWEVLKWKNEPEEVWKRQRKRPKLPGKRSGVA